jgi:hypothetical protein
VAECQQFFERLKHLIQVVVDATLTAFQTGGNNAFDRSNSHDGRPTGSQTG